MSFHGIWLLNINTDSDCWVLSLFFLSCSKMEKKKHKLLFFQLNLHTEKDVNTHLNWNHNREDMQNFANAIAVCRALSWRGYHMFFNLFFLLFCCLKLNHAILILGLNTWIMLSVCCDSFAKIFWWWMSLLPCITIVLLLPNGSHCVSGKPDK